MPPRKGRVEEAEGVSTPATIQARRAEVDQPHQLNEPNIDTRKASVPGERLLERVGGRALDASCNDRDGIEVPRARSKLRQLRFPVLGRHLDGFDEGLAPA